MNPLSAIYGALSGIRNAFYDRGVLREQRLTAPVVSVGNLSVGGSGKTPFVIMLGEFLRQRRVPFDVLSRGYGRRTKGVLAVDPNGSAQDFGDEPLLISRSTGGPVFVGESRYEAGLLAEKTYATKVHILDDGFQHRALARDLDIVLLTPEDLRDRLLPVGRLREPLVSLHRADVMVVPEEMEVNALPLAQKSVWRARRRLALIDPPRNPVVFCGIARPDRFLSQLQAEDIRTAAVKIYRDHHHYSRADVQELLRLRDQKNADGFITTEKDGLNLGVLLAELGKVAIAQLKMEIVEPSDALERILRLIAERAPRTHETIRGR